MKLTQYFSTKAEMDAYFPNGVPSNVLAIVQPDAETPAALYTSSNNSPVGGGSSEEQGGPGQGGDTTPDKISNWQDKFGDALQAVAAALYQADNTLGEPVVKDNADWCVKTAVDGDAALSDMVAMSTLWIEIYDGQSNAHEIWSQVLSNMEITITDADKEIPFEVGEDCYMVLSTPKNMYTINGLAGFKNSNSSNILSNQWSWYGIVFNGTGLECSYITATDNDVDLVAMRKKMEDDGVTISDIGIPVLTLANYINYIKAYENGVVGSAYFYVVRNPEEENEEIIPFVDHTAEAGYPCFSYNFGNFEYTQGEGAQLVIFPMSSEEEGVDKTAIRAKIKSPLFNTEGEDPVDVYAGGPSTIETSNDSAETQVIIGQTGYVDAPGAPAVYITRNISNLEYYIEKPDSSSTWTGRWEWQ